MAACCAGTCAWWCEECRNYRAKQSRAPCLASCAETPSHETSSSTSSSATDADTINLSWSQLEIWGRAQREAARRRKFDWGGQVMGWNFVCSKVTWPERNCIIIYIYSKRNAKLGWFEMRQQNFVCEPKLTIFSVFDVKSIVVVNAVYILSTSLSVFEIFAIKF